MVPLTPQEILRSGLESEPLADEIVVRVKIGYMWLWPVKAKGPYDAEPTSFRMVDMILQGFQFPHVGVPLRAHGYTGRMPSGEEFRFQSPYEGVAIVPWPLQYVSATGMYDGPVGAAGRHGHRCSLFTDFRYDDTTPLSAQALERLHDCGADHTDLEFLVLANGQGGTQNTPLPWVQAALLGMPSPMHLKQRIVGRLGRDFVGPFIQPTENIRSFCRESGMPRSTVLVSRQGNDVQFRLVVAWDHVSRKACVSVTTLRRMMGNENIKLLSGESDLHEMETLNGVRLLWRCKGRVLLRFADWKDVWCRVIEDSPMLGETPGMEMTIPTFLAQQLRVLLRDDPTTTTPSRIFGAEDGDDDHHSHPAGRHIGARRATSSGTWSAAGGHDSPADSQMSTHGGHTRTWMKFGNNVTDRFEPQAPLEYRTFVTSALGRRSRTQWPSEMGP